MEKQKNEEPKKSENPEELEEDKFISSYIKAKTVLKEARFDPLIIVKTLDRFLDWIRGVLPPEIFGKAANWCRRYGQMGLLASAALSFLFWTVAAMKLDFISLPYGLLYGIACAAFFIILQYTASKFLNAGESLIKSSPSRLASASFLDCTALLMEIAGIVLFIMLVRGSFFVALGACAICECIFFVALHPSLANIKISKKAAAGEEAIGILSFFVKSIVRIVPLAFGIGSIFGLIALAIATAKLPFKAEAYLGGILALKLIIFCACLPFASYIIFALYHLTIDVLRAILVLPGKLDDLKEEKK
ncbi:hypothetical protein ACFLS1_03980 [Verrucomicrobiota bacterium]